MEEIIIDIKELEEITVEDEREVVIEEVSVYPELENLTVTPSGEQQIFNHPNSYGYDEVIVEAVESEALEVNPTTENQEFNGIYNNVKVNAVTNEIDEDITSNNIKEGIEILGVTGTLKEYKEPILQNKEVIPTTSSQNIVADDGYDGLSSVFINAVTSEIDSNIVAENIKNDVEILGVKGNFAGEKFKPRYVYQSITFQNYTGTELDYEVANLDTTNFKNMSNMFYNCSNLISLDLSEWNTSNVTKMEYMFQNCTNLTSLNTSGWNTNNVTTMTYMFYSCNNLNKLDLSNWNTNNVTNMNYLFNKCTSLNELDVSGWNTSNVTNMNSMFRECPLSRLDLSSFNTSNVTNMSYMFYSCENLMYLDIRNFDFTKVTSYSSVFGSSNINAVPNDCLIIVKGETEKQWVLARRSQLTNVKTVAELGE